MPVGGMGPDVNNMGVSLQALLTMVKDVPLLDGENSFPVWEKGI